MRTAMGQLGTSGDPHRLFYMGACTQGIPDRDWKVQKGNAALSAQSSTMFLSVARDGLRVAHWATEARPGPLDPTPIRMQVPSTYTDPVSLATHSRHGLFPRKTTRIRRKKPWRQPTSVYTYGLPT